MPESFNTMDPMTKDVVLASALLVVATAFVVGNLLYIKKKVKDYPAA
jgi:hypothetical protein